MLLFDKKKKYTALRSCLSPLLLIMVLTMFTYFSDFFLQANRTQEKELLENALTRSITYCYALEGTYPLDLSYLIEHYGLSYNEEHFFVDYQYTGGNLRPDVTIIERN